MSSSTGSSSLLRLNLSHDPLLSVLRADLLELQEEQIALSTRRHQHQPAATNKRRNSNKNKLAAQQNGSHKHEPPSQALPPPLADVYTLTPSPHPDPSVPNHFKPTASFIAGAANHAAANTLMHGKTSGRKMPNLQVDGLQSDTPRMGPLIVFPSTATASNGAAANNVARYKAHVYNNESHHITQKAKHASQVAPSPISPATPGVSPMEEKILDHFLTNEQKATRKKNQLLLTNSAIRDERKLKILEEQEMARLAEIEQQRIIYEERQAAHNYAQQIQFEQQQQLYNQQQLQLIQQQHHLHHPQPPSFPHYYQAPTYFQPHLPPILAPLISAPVPPLYDHHALSVPADAIFSLGGDNRRREHMINGVSLPPLVQEQPANNHPRPSPIPLHTVSNHSSRQSSDQQHVIVANSTTPPPPKVSALNVGAIEQSSGNCSPVSDVHTRSTSHEGATSASPSGESNAFNSSTSPSTTSPPNLPLPPPHPPHRHRRSDSAQSPTAAQKEAVHAHVPGTVKTPHKPAHGRNVSMDNALHHHQAHLDVAELMQVHAELATLEPETHPTALICDSQAVQTNAILAQEKPWLHYDPMHPSSVIHHEAQHLIDEMRITPSPVHLHKSGAQATAAAIVRARQHSVNVTTPAPTPLPRQATSPLGSSGAHADFTTVTAGSSPRRTSHRRSISHGGASSHASAQLSAMAAASGLSSPTAREGSPASPPLPERATSLDAVQTRLLTAQHMLDEALDAANKVQSASTIISPSGPPPTPSHGPMTPSGRRASKVLHPRQGSLIGMGSLLGNNLSVPATPRSVHARRPSSSLMSSLIDDEFDNLVHESIEDRLESNRAEADPEYGRKRALLLAKGPKHSPKPEHDMATWAQLVHEHMVHEKKIAAEEAERKRKEDEEKAKSMSNAPTPRRMQSFLFRAQSVDDMSGGADGFSPDTSELNYHSMDSSRFHSLPDVVAEGDDEA